MVQDACIKHYLSLNVAASHKVSEASDSRIQPIRFLGIQNLDQLCGDAGLHKPLDPFLRSIRQGQQRPNSIDQDVDRRQSLPCEAERPVLNCRCHQSHVSRQLASAEV
jgi:hypothetical protein